MERSSQAEGDPSSLEAEQRPSPLIAHSLTDARGSASALKHAPTPARAGSFFGTRLTLDEFLQEESEADLVTGKLSGMFRRG
jgi:hypothetical protein